MILFDCLSSAKAYLDSVAGYSETDLQPWSGIMWARLRYVITLVTRLTFTTDEKSPLWTLESVRRTLPLELYIENICEKLRNITIQITNVPKTGDWYQFFLKHLESANAFYLDELSKRGIMIESAAATSLTHQQPRNISTEQANVSLEDTRNGTLLGSELEDLYSPEDWFPDLDLDFMAHLGDFELPQGAI
jgi:hypothetical protein